MTVQRVIRHGARAFGAALLVVSQVAGAQDIAWSGSLAFYTGSYGYSEQLSTFSLLNSLTVRAGRLELTASIPVLGMKGSTVGYSAEDSMIVAATGAFSVKLADPLVGASLSAYEGRKFLRSFRVEGYVKPPIASVASGVGTGSWDYGTGASLVAGAGGVLVFANATWWILGDMPDLQLRDALFYSVSLGIPIGNAWSMIASASASTRTVEGIDPPVSANLMLSRRVARGAWLNGGVGAGLSESAPALTVSLGWTLMP